MKKQHFNVGDKVYIKESNKFKKCMEIRTLTIRKIELCNNDTDLKYTTKNNYVFTTKDINNKVFKNKEYINIE